MSEVNTSDIRKAIGEVVANSKSEEYVLRDEFGGGIMRTVADVAVFTPTSIILIEVKSNKDTLNRLESQLADYEKYADQVILVIDVKHIKKYLEQREKGFFKSSHKVYAYKKGRIRKIYDLSIVQSINPFVPTFRTQDKNLLHFLWHDEVKNLLKFLKGRSGHEQRKLVRKVFTAEELQSVCKEVLYDRMKQIENEEDKGVDKFTGGKPGEIINKDIKQMIFDRYRK